LFELTEAGQLALHDPSGNSQAGLVQLECDSHSVGLNTYTLRSSFPEELEELCTSLQLFEPGR
jgi:hypothetical protein